MKNPILIAECGNNHEGSMEVALILLEKAAESGADLVKFQAGTADGFARDKADIQRYRKYELGKGGYLQLIHRGKELGVPVFFSIWAGELEDLNSEWKKIPARQYSPQMPWLDDKTFISIPHLASFSENPNIGRAIPLHCVEEYPTKDPMLHRIDFLRRIFNRPVGFSDHSIGIDAAIEAVEELDAVAIEKHFTLDHDFGPLRDHQHSATPEEFKKLAEAIKWEP